MLLRTLCMFALAEFIHCCTPESCVALMQSCMLRSCSRMSVCCECCRCVILIIAVQVVQVQVAKCVVARMLAALFKLVPIAHFCCCCRSASLVTWRHGRSTFWHVLRSGHSRRHPLA